MRSCRIPLTQNKVIGAKPDPAIHRLGFVGLKVKIGGLDQARFVEALQNIWRTVEPSDRLAHCHVVRRCPLHVQDEIADDDAAALEHRDAARRTERGVLRGREVAERHVDRALLQRELHGRRLRVVVDDHAAVLHGTERPVGQIAAVRETLGDERAPAGTERLQARARQAQEGQSEKCGANRRPLQKPASSHHELPPGESVLGPRARLKHFLVISHWSFVIRIRE